MIDRSTFPAVLALALLVLILAMPGCRRGHRGHGGDDGCVTPTQEHGDPRVGYGPKNPCPCDRD